jgi:hypothetical protein
LSLDSVYLRCFVDTHKPESEPEFRIEPRANPTMEVVLYVPRTKKLDFGMCGIWVNERLFRLYAFYNDDAKEGEIENLRKICSSYPVTILSRTEFVESVFFPYVFRARAKCIGFELPYAISRLAIDVTESRRYQNGFSFTLSGRAKFPHIVIKSIDSKSQFIEFNKPIPKKNVIKSTFYRGAFVDNKTLGFVLTNDTYDLESALSDFDCPIKLLESKKSGISEQNFKVGLSNILAYHALYKQQMKRLENFCIIKPEHRLVSSASIGKSYLEKIGIKPFLEQNLKFPPELLGYLMSTFYGARVEARIIHSPTLVTNLDFTSMYPTLFVLFGMYRFLIADTITHHYTTKETQEFLDQVTVSDINKPEFWPKTLTICKIAPDGDFLPVRSDYDSKIPNIGVNYLKSKDGIALWYVLPDLIASKLHTGKTPQILEAITFVPQGVQSGLQDIEILKGITLQKGEDLFKKLVECRFELAEQIKNLTGDEKKQQEQIHKVIKTIANSSAYGIFIQLNTKKTMLPKQVTVYGLESFDTQTNHIENAGQFFNPIISVFLTAGARLVLATVEHLLKQNNGYLVYCDTDAVFVSPQHTELIQGFFRKLNPYSKDVELFKIQKENGKELKNVLVYAISPKRYAIYEKKGNKITIHKYSNHALGHLLGIDHEQVWRDIILLHYHPEKEQEILARYSTKYAMSELTITNYDFFRRFGVLNQGKSYSEIVKPYDSVLIGNAYKKDRKTGVPIVPFVPKTENLDEIPFGKFIDYKSGVLYPNSDSFDSKDYWKPMSVSFSEYRKFGARKSNDILKLMFGKETIKYVGKEINELESSTVFGVSKEDSITYENQDEKIRRFLESLTEEKVRELGISRRTFFDWKKKLRGGKPIKMKKKHVSRIFQISGKS